MEASWADILSLQKISSTLRMNPKCLKLLDVCVDAILNEKKEKRFGELVRKIGIDEFKRRLKGDKDLLREQVNGKEIVHSGTHN